MTDVAVVGGGLAGCEAAWALAERGCKVALHEMRPEVKTAAHQTDRLAEIVCSNTFKSLDPTNAHGLLKLELRLLGSILLEAADRARVPGGQALAVDREIFSSDVTERVTAHPNITVVRGEIRELPSPAVIATGPLTSPTLAAAIREKLGLDALAFYDAIAPIVSLDSLDTSRLYRLSRYGKGGGDDYFNAPMDRATYESFIDALCAADQFKGHEFDKISATEVAARQDNPLKGSESPAVPYFEGCLPIEEMAQRGRETLRHGPMKPFGLPDPRTGREPYAVVQLRQEDRAGQMWNLVGFQTRLKIPEQKRVLAMIPGLAQAEFLRYGSIHRNTYINSPAALTPHLSARDDDRLLFAGQLTGVEGYTESLGTGLLAGINMARLLSGAAPIVPPPVTMLGALLRYVNEADPKHFQPMNANFGLLPPAPSPLPAPGARDESWGGSRDQAKKEKKEWLVERALAAMREFAGQAAAVPA